MPGIFKKLSANDIKITPFEAHKTYSSTDLSSIGVSTDFISWAPYNKFYFKDGNRKYFQLDKLYYRDYIRERAHRLELDDATYTTQERRLYQYANVISLPQRNFGNEVQPGTFIVSCSYADEQFYIQDDSFGNLYDVNLGRDNFPNEDYRILYLGPTQAFKRTDLTVDYETGKKYVNPPFTDGYTRTVYDDSYFLNEVEFDKVIFATSSNSGFYSLQSNNSLSTVKIPHQPQFNFETEDDFTINFYYDITNVDRINSSVSSDYYILSKEGTKYVPILPSEGTQYTSLSTTGSAKIGTAPAGPQFPYRIYYKGNYPATDTASIFFERSDGDTTQFVSASFFTSGSLEIQRFISCKNDNGTLKLQINNETEVSSSGQNSPTLNKTCSNKANIALYAKINPDNSLSNRIGAGAGKISQLMMWNQALSDAERTNVSQSIVGTPNIGNIFYDNGFAVVTHPSYRNVLNNYDITNTTTIVSGNYSGSSGVGYAPQGFEFNNDGTKIFTVSFSSDLVGEFTLDTPYDITTLTSVSASYDFGIQPSSIIFSPDGLDVYISNTSAYTIKQYKLTSSFDLNTIDNTKTYIFKPDAASTYAIRFNNDGTKFYRAVPSFDALYQYKLKTPYDLRTAEIEYIRNVGSGGDEQITSNFGGINFDSSGYNMFLVGSGTGIGGAIFHYILNIPFDISTATFLSRLDLSTIGLSITPTEIILNSDNNTFYTAGSIGDYIYEVSMEKNINRFEYKNTHLITENEYQCTVREDEFEMTTNTSIRKIPFSDSEDIANFATGSNFKPYVTSVGLYDDSGNLLVVGKLGQPIKVSSETDTTFVIRFDT